MSVQTVTLNGKRFVILPEADYQRMVVEPPLPVKPAPDSDGNYPAVETARVILARKLIRDRRAAGLTQEELAKLAGIRAATLRRAESGQDSPSVATVDKIVRALERVPSKRR